MKTCKLWMHPKKDAGETELMLNAKDFPLIQTGDIVEIYDPDTEAEHSRLLLQVQDTSITELQQKDVVSVAQAIAQNFHLRMYKDVRVSIVDPKDVALDLVELNYKEQYFSRTDMWRLRRNLVNSCMYLHKKLKFAEMRAEIIELWSKGERVTCGVVTSETRVTFRSLTAQVNIFIQMSSEMWMFDNYGELYFEKAVGGFLVDLFTQWKDKNHDVTITLFSRTLYDAKSIEDFPIYMRECIQEDHQGRFYEDFYRVVVQNERYDDWTPTLITLKKLFIEYPQRVLHYHERPGVKVPAAYNSTAAQGNFLEVLNMALNVFEKYYLDRCFDRTGKLSLVITPGVGVFEVDRELTNVTKQRTIDCGNSSDLVCMGEQPLHAVPLFKFHNKFPSRKMVVGDDYNIPHWINYSFYTSRTQMEQMKTSKFIPRIKMPLVTPMSGKDAKLQFSARQQQQEIHLENTQHPYLRSDDDNFPFVDYDAYDAQVFKLTSNRSSQNSQLPVGVSKSASFGRQIPHKRVRRVRYNSDMYDLFLDRETCHASLSKAIAILPQRKRKDSEEYMSNSFGGQGNSSTHSEEAYSVRQVVGSAGNAAADAYFHPHPLTRARPHRALINPFAPSRLHFKVTSNRRRWAHAFPTDLRGASVQPHHQTGGPTGVIDQEEVNLPTSPPTREAIQAAQFALEIRRQRSSKLSESSDSTDHSVTRQKTTTVCSTESGSMDSLKEHSSSVTFGMKHNNSAISLQNVDSTNSIVSVINTLEMQAGAGCRTQSSALSYSRSSSYHKDLAQYGLAEEGHNWLWGITGEQEWTPLMTTGMDWKSMTSPASLPITTDYFPDKHSLHTDYVTAEYSLLPEDVNRECWGSTVRKPLTTKQVYYGMVGQRLAQGFQIVILPKKSNVMDVSHFSSSPYSGGTSSLMRSRAKAEATEEHILSIGRIFHKLTLKGNTITVTRYWPRHLYAQKTVHVPYRFQVPDSDSYDVSWTNFSTEKLENYNWNYVDQYICTRGEEDYGLMKSLKYWRSTFFLLPCNSSATRKIIEGSSARCDIYEDRSQTEQQALTEGFIRFIEIMNKIRRSPNSRKPKMPMTRRSSLTHSPGGVAVMGLEKEKTQDSYLGESAKFKAMGKVNESLDSPGIGLMASPVPSSVEHRKMTSTLSLDSNSLTSSLFTTSSPAGKSEVTCTKLADGEKSESLTASSPHQAIVDAMLDPNCGLYFLQKTPGLADLPPHSFVAAEATAWVKANIQGITTTMEAIQLMQSLVDEQLMLHASGNPQHRFINGFYLYSLQSEKEKYKDAGPLLYPAEYYYNTSFQYEWCEVATHEIATSDNTTAAPFLQKTIPRHYIEPSIESNTPEQPSADHSWGGRTNQLPFMSGSASSRRSGTPDLTLDLSRMTSRSRASPSYKLVNVDIDSNQKSDRQEWGTASYHGNFCPVSAFEIEIQWLVATGCITGDLIQTWARKAGSCGFHLLPVPGDPFALPFDANSDPLRGPIFIPLEISCLMDNKLSIFEEFDIETREERLLLFQDSILKRFGFMLDKPPNVGLQEDTQPQYVHCTGGMFVLIPDNKTTSPRNRDGTHRKPVVGSYKDYIAWQRGRSESLVSTDGAIPYHHEDDSQKIGFLWAWNFMLNKRWRTSNTGDEHFQDKMLADFRAFCSNHNNRLKDYWVSCWKTVLDLEKDAENLQEDETQGNGNHLKAIVKENGVICNEEQKSNGHS